FQFFLQFRAEKSIVLRFVHFFYPPCPFELLKSGLDRLHPRGTARPLYRVYRPRIKFGIVRIVGITAQVDDPPVIDCTVYFLDDVRYNRLPWFTTRERPFIGDKVVN